MEGKKKRRKKREIEKGRKEDRRNKSLSLA
jgi:hypothetical protein